MTKKKNPRKVNRLLNELRKYVRICVAALLLFVPTTAGAQHLPVTVTSDRVTIGPEFVPRFLTLPAKLLVSANETRILPADSTFDYVEVGSNGILKCSGSTKLTVTHFFILPGGQFDCPFPLQLVFRDVPIDTTKDPFQWGNGLLNFGSRKQIGSVVTPWVGISDAPAGVSTLSLTGDVTGWAVNDELVLPDTGLTSFPNRPRREANVTILGISGRTVTLSKPLDFAHQTVFGPDGKLGVHPIVLNVTRRSVIRSQNPLGVAGHVADIGESASWDVEWVAFVGLGRTTAAPLDDTSVDLAHTGNNERGRYSDHHHHVHSPVVSKSVGNVYYSVGAGKWGHVLHGTHDTIVEKNIAIGFPGAGFVTEDGYEVRNRYADNLALYNYAPFTSKTQSTTNVASNQPGIEGTGFWMHGVMQFFEGNQAWNNAVGMNLLDMLGKPGMYPSQPGGAFDVSFVPELDYLPSNGPFRSFVNNVFVGNTQFGLDIWGLKKAANEGFLGVNNQVGMIFQPSANQEGWLRNPVIMSSYQTGNGAAVPLDDLYYQGQCLRVQTPYVAGLFIENGYFGGCATGLFGISSGVTWITNTLFQNAVDLDVRDGLSRGGMTFTGLTFKKYGAHPPRFLIAKDRPIWDGTGPMPTLGNMPAPPPSSPPPPPPPPEEMWQPQTMRFEPVSHRPTPDADACWVASTRTWQVPYDVCRQASRDTPPSRGSRVRPNE